MKTQDRRDFYSSATAAKEKAPPPLKSPWCPPLKNLGEPWSLSTLKYQQSAEPLFKAKGTKTGAGQSARQNPEVANQQSRDKENYLELKNKVNAIGLIWITPVSIGT